MRILTIAALVMLASSAEAQRLKLLPPEEFDKPYDGPVAIQHARSQAEVRESCKGMVFNLGVALGCSMVIAGTCLIVKVSDEEIRAAGHDPDVFMRHERAHCVGWPSWHPEAR